MTRLPGGEGAGAGHGSGGGAGPSAGRAVRFTYLDYLELRAWEFEKFRHMPPIAAEEIAAVDWDDLARRLGA